MLSFKLIHAAKYKNPDRLSISIKIMFHVEENQKKEGKNFNLIRALINLNRSADDPLSALRQETDDKITILEWWIFLIFWLLTAMCLSTVVNLFLFSDSTQTAHSQSLSFFIQHTV